MLHDQCAPWCWKPFPVYHALSNKYAPLRRASTAHMNEECRHVRLYGRETKFLCKHASTACVSNMFLWFVCDSKRFMQLSVWVVQMHTCGCVFVKCWCLRSCVQVYIIRSAHILLSSMYLLASHTFLYPSRKHRRQQKARFQTFPLK